VHDHATVGGEDVAVYPNAGALRVMVVEAGAYLALICWRTLSSRSGFSSSAELEEK